MAEGKKDARQKAAEARAAAQAKEKRRERMTRILGGLAVLVIVGAIVGGALYFSGQDSSSNTATPDANASIPVGVSSSNYYFEVNPDVAGDVPTVLIYEDFQCPFCKKLEETSGVTLLEEAKAGKLRLQYQPGIFMDANLQNTGSLTATSAWGCSMDAGKGVEFHEGVFAAQAQQEVVGEPGFTQDQMLALGQSVGITGDAYPTFESCVTSNKYNGWAANSNAQFEATGVSTTPSIFVNGTELDTNGIDIFDPAALLPAIEAAAN